MLEGIKIDTIKAPFARGLVIDKGMHLLPPSYTPYAKNIRVRNGTTIRREGYKKVFDGKKSVQIDEMISVEEYLYVISEKKLWKAKLDEHPSALEQTMAGDINTLTGILKFWKRILFLNGAGSGSAYDTQAKSLTSLAIENWANPRFGETYEQCIYLAGGGTKSNILYKSTVWGEGTALPIFQENKQPKEPRESEQIPFRSKITGLCATREKLFVFTEDSVEVIQDSQTWGLMHKVSIPIAGMNEPANPKMIVKADDRVFFWTKENMMKSLNYMQGVTETAIWDITERANLSIKGFIDSLDADKSSSFGYYHKKNKTVHWHLRLKGEPYTTVVLVYDVNADSFFIDTNKYFTCVVNHRLWYYAGSSNQQIIYEDEVGNSDDWQQIQRERRTAILSLGSPLYRKEFREINIYGEKEDDVNIQISVLVDWKSVYEWEIKAIEWPISWYSSTPAGSSPVAREVESSKIKSFEFAITRGFLRARGKKIQIIFKWNSFGEFCLSGLEIWYKDLYESDPKDRSKFTS